MIPPIRLGSVVYIPDLDPYRKYRVICRANRTEPRQWWLRSFENMEARKAGRDTVTDENWSDCVVRTESSLVRFLKWAKPFRTSQHWAPAPKPVP